MKAVIMAGGEGTRLRPLSLGLPKPMTPLFDRPVMEHSIELLKAHGITDICVTLQYLPRSVVDYFGTGERLGVALTYFVEDSPLGTAGSVKNCMDHLGDDDFLVISGDAVCDLDLTAGMAFHAAHGGAATLLLYRHAAPLEYGLVLTGEDGRIERFIEKPAWNQVFANTVNTGIYFLSRRAVDQVPAGAPCDFGKDLFPKLLRAGEPLYGCVADGFWCDMGDPAAYLDCTSAALSGRVALDLKATRRSPGIWSVEPVPEGVSLIPPCWIGAGVTVGAGSLVGPGTVLGAGSIVGEKSLIQRSVLHGARVGERATLYGAILCRGASVEDGAVLNEGAVLGEHVVCGADATVLEGVKIWPGRQVPRGGRLAFSLTGPGGWSSLRFSDGAVIRGTLNEDISPESLLVLGGILGMAGTVGLGCTTHPGAKMLCRAASAGITAAGATAMTHDGGTLGAAAWFAARNGLPRSLFVEQAENLIFLHCLDERGLPLGRAGQRALEGAFLRGELARAPGAHIGMTEPVTGVPLAFAQDAARRTRLRRMPLLPTRVAVTGSGPSDRILATALEQLGCHVVRGQRPAGVPSFSADFGGLRLLAWDEKGSPVSSERLFASLCLIELEHGCGRVAVPDDAPAAIDTLGGPRAGRVLRLGRDGDEAESLYAALPWLHDAVFAACRVCAYLGLTGMPLSRCLEKLPPFVLRRREVALSRSRGEVMRALAAGRQTPEGDGLRIPVGRGWIYVAPLGRRASLRVIAEGHDAETASELCNFFIREIQKIDEQAAPGK